MFVIHTHTYVCHTYYTNAASNLYFDLHHTLKMISICANASIQLAKERPTCSFSGLLRGNVLLRYC